jgi:hypothetical protein
MVLVTLFGVLSYGKLSQSEDPPFTFKVMVIQHATGPAPRQAGPGGGHRPDRAQAAGDAADRFPAQLFAARRIDCCSSPSRIPRRPQRAGDLVPGAQEGRRHGATSCPPACRDPISTTNSAMSTPTSTRSRAMASRRRSCTTMPISCAPSCCACRRQQGRLHRRSEQRVYIEMANASCRSSA